MAKQTKKTETPLPEAKPVKEKKAVKAADKKVVTPAEKPATAKKAAAKSKPAVAATFVAKVKPSTPKTHEILNAVEPYSRFTDFDISLFKSGKHYKLYEKFGSHVVEFNGVIGTYFSVWAPNAQYVSVIANFNGWNRG